MTNTITVSGPGSGQIAVDVAGFFLVQVTVIDAKDFWHDHATAIVVRPVQIVVVLLIALIVRILLHRMVNRLARSVDGKVPRILSPLTESAALSGLWQSAGLVSERRRQRAETIASVAKSAVSVTVLTLAVLVSLGLVGVDLVPFIAGTSIIGVALGFGAQNVIKDFLAGMFMLLEDQYGVGDYIDLKEASGTVEAIGLRTTRLRDQAGTVWYVRNGEIVRVGNQTQNFAQVVLDIPIDAAEDVRSASDYIATAAAGLYADEHWRPAFLAEPEVLGVESMSREETVIRLVARVRPLEQWRVARELRIRIKEQPLD